MDSDGCYIQMLYPDVLKIGTLISSFVVDSMIPSAKALCLSCDSSTLHQVDGSSASLRKWLVPLRWTPPLKMQALQAPQISASSVADGISMGKVKGVLSVLY